MRRPDNLRDLPRLLHPAAWWVWGLGLATAASRTTNPFLLLLVVAVAAWVVMERREIGATNVLFEPVRACLPTLVRCLLTPS